MDFPVLILLGAGILVSFLSALSILKLGYRSLWVLVPLVLGLLVFVARYPEQTPVYIAPIITGIIFGYIVRENKSFQYFITATSLVLTVVFLLHHYYLIFLNKFDLISYLLKEISRSQFTEEQKTIILGNKDLLISLTRLFIPFVFFIKAILLSFIFYTFNKHIFESSIIKGPVKYKRLELYKVNDYVIFVLIGSIIGSILADKYDLNWLMFISLNTLLIVGCFYFIQSLGIFRFILIKKKWPTFILPLFFIAIVFFLKVETGSLAFTMIFFAALGVLDLWADFRKLNQISKESEVKE